MERSTHSSRYFVDSNDPESLFFNIYIKSLDKNNPLTAKDLATMEEIFPEMKAFHPIEKEKILHSIFNEILLKKRDNQPQHPDPIISLDTIVQIKNQTDRCPECRSQVLEPSKCKVKTYTKKLFGSVGYVLTQLMVCNQCHLSFGYDRQIQDAIKLASPHTIKRILHPTEYPPKKKAEKIMQEGKIIKKVGGTIFLQASTNSTEATKLSQNNTTNFRDTTDLYELGYRITGRSRGLRWEILQRKAIPNLPLKDIVLTIARNVRLRKAQSGGMKKFAHAITEWEHDLQRLKQEYYKGDFTWPKY